VIAVVWRRERKGGNSPSYWHGGKKKKKNEKTFSEARWETGKEGGNPGGKGVSAGNVGGIT